MGYDLIAFCHVPAVIRGGIRQDGRVDVYRLRWKYKLDREGSSPTLSRNELPEYRLNFDPFIAKHREVYSGPIIYIKPAEHGKKVTDTVETDRIRSYSPRRKSSHNRQWLVFSAVMLSDAEYRLRFQR